MFLWSGRVSVKMSYNSHELPQSNHSMCMILDKSGAKTPECPIPTHLAFLEAAIYPFLKSTTQFSVPIIIVCWPHLCEILSVLRACVGMPYDTAMVIYMLHWHLFKDFLQVPTNYPWRGPTEEVLKRHSNFAYKPGIGGAIPYQTFQVYLLRPNPRHLNLFALRPS